MSIDELSKAAGVLGFFISLATFALTRWERRVVLDFGIDSGECSMEPVVGFCGGASAGARDGAAGKG